MSANAPFRGPLKWIKIGPLAAPLKARLGFCSGVKPAPEDGSVPSAGRVPCTKSSAVILTVIRMSSMMRETEDPGLQEEGVQKEIELHVPSAPGRTPTLVPSYLPPVTVLLTLTAGPTAPQTHQAFGSGRQAHHFIITRMIKSEIRQNCF